MIGLALVLVAYAYRQGAYDDLILDALTRTDRIAFRRRMARDLDRMPVAGAA